MVSDDSLTAFASGRCEGSHRPCLERVILSKHELHIFKMYYFYNRKDEYLDNTHIGETSL